MNIFYFDEDVDTCARYHCDAHVIKMILESAQILCTVSWMHEIPAPYRPTHQKHPCVIWSNESMANWLWLKDLARALNQEYQYRFNHINNHRSYNVIQSLIEPPLPFIGLTKRPQVMPAEHQNTSPVKAYCRYFAHCKSHLAKWTKRPVPEWYQMYTNPN